MPRIPHNIEARPFAGHSYRVGYGAGLVWRITRSTSSFGSWCARAQGPDADRVPLVFAFTLADLGPKLEAARPTTTTAG